MWASGRKRDITLAWFLVFLSFLSPQVLLASRQETTDLILRGLFQTMSNPDYCMPRGLKMQKVFVILHFNPKMGRE